MVVGNMLSSKVRTLLAVADTRNFTRAAMALSLTQPAVSHHIRQLEEELGVSLFIRQKNGLKLTPEGEIVVRYAKRMARPVRAAAAGSRQQRKAAPAARRHHPHGREQSDHRCAGHLQQPDQPL